MHLDFSSSIISPSTPPGIPNPPIFFTVLFSPSEDTDYMINFAVSTVLAEYAFAVPYEKFVRSKDSTSNGSSLEDFLFDIGRLFSSDFPVFRREISSKSFLSETLLMDAIVAGHPF